MSSCCSNKEAKKKRFDFLFFGSLFIVLFSYVLYWLFGDFVAGVHYLSVFTESNFNIFNEMFWGMALGILFVGLLDDVPSKWLFAIMGKRGTFSGVARAAFAGVLLDLCSHGILLVAMKLYKKGLGLGQVMAFLIASPWNSLSLTLVLWALVGLKWTIVFLLGSMVVAIMSGVIFNLLVKKGVLPDNEIEMEVSEVEELKIFQWNNLNPLKIFGVFFRGLKGSKMILRWLLFGMVLASLVRTFVPPESFEVLFGPTVAGLALTLVVATVLEVCSEGSTPIAADILNRAFAPGNAFGFLMTGVSTDYTEILVLKETTGNWKVSFFLPLVTLPQVILLAVIMNGYG